MKRFREFFVVAFLVVTMVLGIQSVSQAALVMGLWDGGTNYAQITDDGLNDYNPATGAISFQNFSFGNWLFTADVALSKPFYGTAGSPKMDLLNLSMSNPQGGTLYIAAVDTDFSGPLSGGNAGPFKLAAGGTTLGNIEFYAFGSGTNFIDISNPLASVFAHLGPFSTPAFSGVTTGSFNAKDLFALGIGAKIVHRGGETQATSFDAHLTPVPVPAAFWLLGSGILGLVGFRRKMVA
jgi:hypothetical protein